MLNRLKSFFSLANQRRSPAAASSPPPGESPARELDALLAAERKRARQMELVTDIARHLTRLDEPQVLMREAVRRLVDDFGYSHASLLLVEGDHLVEKANYGLFTDALQVGYEVRLGQGIIGWAALNGTHYLANDCQSDPQFVPLNGAKIGSELAVPMRLGKSVVGVLNIDSEQPNMFDTTDCVTLQSVADMLASALQTQGLLAELQARERVADALRRVGTAATSSLDLDTVLNTICTETAAAFAADGALVWLVEGDEMRLAAGYGFDLEQVSDLRVHLSDGFLLSARAVSEKRPMFANGPVVEGGALSMLYEVTQAQSVLAMPMIREGLPLGAIAVWDAHSTQRFTLQDLAAADLLGGQLAAAVHNARLYSEWRQRAQQMATLNELAHHMTGILELRDLCSVIAQRLFESFGFNGVSILTANKDGRELVLQGVAGIFAGVLQPGAYRQAYGHGIIGEAAQSGLPQHLKAPGAHDAFFQPRGVTIRSELAVPLKVGDRVVGVRAVSSHKPYAITDDDQVMLITVASQLAVAIEKVRLFEETSQRARSLGALYETALLTSGMLETDALLERLSQQISAIIVLDAVGVIFYDAARQELALAYALERGKPLDKALHKSRPISEGGLTGWVIQNRLPLLAGDLETEPTPAVPRHLSGRSRAWLGVPLIARDVVLGAISVQSFQPYAFDEADQSLLVSLAAQLAIALENVRLYNSVQQQASEIGALYRASEALLNPGVDIAVVAARIVQAMTDEFQFVHCDVRLLEGPTARLNLAAQAGSFEVSCPPLQVDGPGIVASAARSGELVYFPDVTRAPTYVAGHSQTRSELAVPLFAGQHLIGVLNLESPEIDGFSERDRRIVSAFAERAALALDHARLVEAERRRASQLSILYELSREIAGTLDPTAIYQKATEALVTRFGFAEAAVMIPAGNHELELVARTFTEDTGVGIGYRQREDTGVIGHAVQTGTLYVSNDISTDPYYFSPLGRRVGSAVALPLRRDEALLGVLYIENGAPGTFSPEDVQALETLTSHIATAVQNASLYRRVSDRLREMTGLQSMTQAVASSLDLNEVFETVVLLLHNIFGYRFVSLALVEGDYLRLVAEVGYVTQMAHPLMSIDTGIGGRAARTGRPQYVRDVRADPEYLLGSDAVESEIAVPLLKDQVVLGVINVSCGSERVLNETDVNLLITFAGQVSVVMENARLFQAEREQRELAEALRTASAALTESLNTEKVLDGLLDQIERVVPYDSACILQVQDGLAHATRLRGYERFGATMESQGAVLLDIATSPNLLAMLRSGQPRIVADTHDDRDWIHLGLSHHVHSWVGAPILVEGKVAAFFSLDKIEAGFYETKHAQRLAAFAGHASLALQNARLYEDAERRAAELEALRQASLTLTSSLDRRHLLDSILQSATALLPGMSNGHIFLYSDGVLSFGSALTEAGYLDEPYSAPRPEGITNTVAQTGQPIVVSSMRDHPLFAGAPPKWEGAIVGLPLKIGNRVVGVMNLACSTPRQFSDSELRVLRLLGDQAAIAIENGRLYEGEREQRRLAEALRDAARTLNSTLDLRHILDRLLEELAHLIPFDTSLVVMNEGESFRLVAGRGVQNAEQISNLIISGSDALLAETSRRRRPMVLDDAQSDPRFIRWFGTEDVRGWIGVPLISRDSVIGALIVNSRRAGAYSMREAEIAFAFAGQAAIAIENARLYEDLQARAEMLGALNATSLDISIPYELPVLLKTIVERAARLLHAPSGGLYLCEPDREEVRCVVAHNNAYDYTGVVLKFGEGAAGRVAQTGQPLIIDDYRAWPERNPGMEAAQPFVAMISVPMFWLGRVTGVILVEDHSGDRRFTQADLEPLTHFALQAAVAVENARLLSETRRRADEQRLLFDAARDFSAGLDEDGVLRAVAGHMVAALHVSNCVVSRWEPEHDRVVTLLDYDVTQRNVSDPPGTLYALADYPATREVLTSRRSIVIDIGDPASDPAEGQLLKAAGYQSALLIPLAAADKVYGLIELFREPQFSRFSLEEIELAQSLAAQAAGALENAMLHTTVIERARELDALLKANASLLSTLELDPLLRNVLMAAIQAIPSAEKGTILLIDPASGNLQMRASVGYTDPRVRQAGFASRGGYSAKAARDKIPLLVVDAQADASIRYNGDVAEVKAIRSAVVAPLMWRNEPTGVISVDSTKVGAFNEADLRLLVAFATTASAAIEHARLHAEVQTLAITDSVTSLTNRREFDRALDTEMSRAIRYDYSLSLIILDIDDFKRYNDTFGHPAGDVRLAAIAGLLKANVRDPDLAARYGGEEFAIILPHTDKIGALVLADRVRAAAEAAAPPGSPPGAPISGYTLSIGVATFPEDAATGSTLLRAADDAELSAKRSGKNRVCTAS